MTPTCPRHLHADACSAVVDTELLDACAALDRAERWLRSEAVGDPDDVLADLLGFELLLRAERFLPTGLLARALRRGWEAGASDLAELTELVLQEEGGDDVVVGLLEEGATLPLTDDLVLELVEHRGLSSGNVPELGWAADPDDQVIWHLKYAERGWDEFLVASQWLTERVRLEDWDCPRFPIWAGVERPDRAFDSGGL